MDLSNFQFVLESCRGKHRTHRFLVVGYVVSMVIHDSQPAKRHNARFAVETFDDVPIADGWDDESWCHNA